MSAIAVDLVAKIKSREAECRAGGPDPHLAMSGMIALGGLDLQHVVEQQASRLVGPRSCEWCRANPVIFEPPLARMRTASGGLKASVT